MVARMQRSVKMGRAGEIRTSRRPSLEQRGVMLLEVLIAILIFSAGILGIVGLLAQSIRHVNDAEYRSEAIFLANGFISEMWTDDRTALDPSYLENMYGDAGSGDGYLALQEMVLRLPGAGLTGNEPTVEVGAGPSTTSTQVTVTLYWQLPGEATPHNYSTTAVIGRNP